MAKNGNILNTISSLYRSLTKTEKKIADAILLNPDLAVQAPLAEIAAHLEVGEATFVRFCRTLGFKGFSDFKLELSIELATKDGKDNTVLDSDITDSDNSLNIAHKLKSAINNVMDETINLLDFEQLEEAVKAIQQANRVFLFGVGTSGITAEDAKNKLMRIGVQVDATGNNHFMYMQASLLTKKDVAIGLSHSGYSQETTHTMKIAKENGAKTIAITHSLRSPITEYADLVLVNGNKQGKLQGDSIGTKIAQLFVLDLIYALLVQASQESAVKNDVVSQKQKSVKLSYKEQRELEQLPQLLEELEEKITALQAEIGDPHFFQQAHDVTDAKLKELSDTEAELETAFLRWEELEEKKTQAEAK